MVSAEKCYFYFEDELNFANNKTVWIKKILNRDWFSLFTWKTKLPFIMDDKKIQLIFIVNLRAVPSIKHHFITSKKKKKKNSVLVTSRSA